MRIKLSLFIVLSGVVVFIPLAVSQPDPELVEQAVPRPIIPKPIVPRPVTAPQPVQNDPGPNVEAYRRLAQSGLSQSNLAANQDFVDRFPGSQLSLRRMRDIAVFFLLKDQTDGNNPLETCARWMETRFSSEAYSWNRYMTATDSHFLDRVETHLLLARILASVGKYDHALRALTEIQTEGEKRSALWNSRSDIRELLDFTRCWCFDGNQDFQTALSLYEQFLRDYPSSTLQPGALRNAATCAEQVGPQSDRSKTENYRSRLAEEYSGSPEATVIKRRSR